VTAQETLKNTEENI